jgi:transcriptional regulator NrdR family protein
MYLPQEIEHSLKCPYCAGNFDAILEWQKANPGSITETLVYYCDNCRNGFTTTESDTISLKHFNNKKLSLIRKDKIKRINEL